MTSEEIRRQLKSDKNLEGLTHAEEMIFLMLGEIAAQLAEVNQHLAEMESNVRYCYVQETKRVR